MLPEKSNAGSFGAMISKLKAQQETNKEDKITKLFNDKPPSS